MNILLVNVDARFNLAMRKCYRFYKDRGENVTMYDMGCDAYTKHNGPISIDGSGYNKVFVSILFENNNNIIVNGCSNVNIGGVGSTNPLNKLPIEIDSIQPFYFENETISYGFITRGCVRKCYFCKVPKTEGMIHFYQHPKDICQLKKTVFYDNNILAYNGHMDIFQWLLENNIKCQFNQGLDFRLTNHDNLKILSRIKLFGDVIFAFDDILYQKAIDEKSPEIFRFFNTPWRTKWYLYYNPKDPVADLISRVNWCINHKALPYVMRDVSLGTMKGDLKNFITDISAYCNQPNMIKKCSFEDFLYKRHSNFERIEASITIWDNNNL